MLHLNFHHEFVKGLGYIKGRAAVICAVIIPVPHVSHHLHIAAHLLLHTVLVYLGSHGHHPVGHRAGIAHKACRAALEEAVCILADGKGAYLPALEYGLVQILIEAHQLIGKVKHYLVIQPAEIHLQANVEYILELVVFLAEIPVLNELCHGYILLHFLRNVQNSVAGIAYQLTFYFPGEKCLYLAPADGAGLSFIEQTHNINPPKLFILFI